MNAVSAFTFKDFMERFPQQSLLTTQLDPTATVIRHVSVAEGEVRSFVRPGELVLTTALGHRDTPEDMLNYIKALYEAEAAGVALTFEDGSLPPKEAVEFAQNAGMPISLLPWELRFSEIVETVLAGIKQEEAKSTASWELLQSQLLSAYIKRGSPARAVELIARHLGFAVMLTGAGDVYISDKPRCHEEDMTPVCPIGVQQRAMGMLYVDKAMPAAAIQSLRDHSSYVVVPLLLWFNGEAIASATRADLISHLVFELVSAGAEDSIRLEARARILGLRLNRKCCCLIGRIIPKRNIELAAWLDTYAQAFMLLVQGFIPDSVAALDGDRLILYIYSGSASDIAAKANAVAAGNYADIALVWGYSAAYEEPVYRDMYAQARFACDLAARESGAGAVYGPRETELMRLVSASAASREAREIARVRLAPLTEYDAAKDSDLVNTLRAYLASNCAINTAARELHIHRQTLRYKLGKIEELTGVSPHDHRSLLALELCLLILDANE